MKEEKDIFDYIQPRKTEVPNADYFKQLTQKVVEEQKSDETSKPGKVIPLYKRPVTWIGVAAAAVVTFLVINVNQGGPEGSGDLLAMSDISSEEAYQYVDEHLDEFDTELLLEAIPASDLEPHEETDPPEKKEEEKKEEKTETTPSTEKISLEDIDTEDILRYLEEQGIDPEELEEDEDEFI